MSGKNNNLDSERRGKILCAYLDGELSAVESAKLERQLHDSPELRAELYGYTSLRDHLGDVDQHLPPGLDVESQRSGVVAILERKNLLGRQKRRLNYRPIFAAAAVILASAVAWLAVTAWPEPTPVVVSSEVVAPAQPVGRAELTVEFHRLAAAELGPISANRQPDAIAPPGTIMVSCGPVADDASMVAGL